MDNAPDPVMSLLAHAQRSVIMRTPHSNAPSYSSDNTWFNKHKGRTSRLRDVRLDFFETAECKFYFGPLWGLIQQIRPAYHLITPIWFGPALWTVEPQDDVATAHIVARALEFGCFDAPALHLYMEQRKKLA